MDYLTFKATLKGAGFSIRDFAQLLQVRSASISNYRSLGYMPHHLVVIALLLAAVHDMGQDPRAILAGGKNTGESSVD